MKRILLIILLYGCSQDAPVYYTYPHFDILTIGSTLTELIISKDDNYLIAADKNNNQIRVISISNDMEITKNLWVGSNPTSLALSSIHMILHMYRVIG